MNYDILSNFVTRNLFLKLTFLNVRNLDKFIMLTKRSIQFQFINHFVSTNTGLNTIDILWNF